ncbi:MAG: zinc dependent phospholipase C family protein [Christensenellaceae bacterium]
MPSTYAHKRFGEIVLARLDEQTVSLIQKYPDLYYVGLHGPDIFFYYKPLKRTEVAQIGNRIHAMLLSDFLGSRRGAFDTEEAKAYLAGLLCHFVLDSECHGYIESKKTEEMGHLLMETEFDRNLMERDGIEPIGYNPGGHLKLTAKEGAVVGRIYGCKGREAVAGVRSMNRMNGVFFAKWAGPIGKLLKRRGIAFGDLFLPEEKIALAEETNRELVSRFEGSVAVAVALIPEVLKCVVSGEFPERTRRNFE